MMDPASDVDESPKLIHETPKTEEEKVVEVPTATTEVDETNNEDEDNENVQDNTAATVVENTTKTSKSKIEPPQPISLTKEQVQPSSNNANQAPQQQQQASSSGWGSWGSWLTAAVDQYVIPTVSTLTETTTQMVRDFVEETPENPEEKKEATTTSENSQKSEKTSEPSEDNNNNNNASNTIDSATDELISVMDKGFSLIGDSVDMLGSYLNQGINKVANVNVNDIQIKAVNMASDSLEKAKKVASSTSELLTNQSVDALEAVGKSALQFLTVKESIDSNGNFTENSTGRTRIRPVFYYIPQMTKEEEANFEKVLNKNYFEENHGAAHLQALEGISIENSMKFQKLEQMLSGKERERLSELLNKIEALYEADEDDEESPIELPEISLNEPAVKHQKTVDIVTREGYDRVSHLSKSFESDMSDLKPKDGSAAVITSIDICHLTATFLDKILLDSIKHLSQLSANSIEQILRVVESVLIDLDSGNHLSIDESMKRINYLFALSQILSDELSKLSNGYIGCIKNVSNESLASFEEFGKKGEAELEESKKCSEDIETKSNLHVNHIYLESSNAISNIQDCRKFLFAISKTILIVAIQSEENSKENSVEENSVEDSKEESTETEEESKEESVEPSQE